MTQLGIPTEAFKAHSIPRGGSQGRHNTVETMLAPRPARVRGTCSRVKFKYQGACDDLQEAAEPTGQPDQGCWKRKKKVLLKKEM